MELSFAVVADVFVAGHTDDGMPYTAEVYFVQAEAHDGRRWNHAVRFYGAVAEHDDETGEPWFRDVRESAKAHAARLLARIEAAGGHVDFAHWCEGRPAYGSPAYCGATEAALEKEFDGQGEYELARVA